jgi:hypothetical protein
MTLFVLILVVITLLLVSYFIIKDGNEQLNDLEDDDDPTITCWDDNDAHTEGNF